MEIQPPLKSTFTNVLTTIVINSFFCMDFAIMFTMSAMNFPMITVTLAKYCALGTDFILRYNCLRLCEYILKFLTLRQFCSHVSIQIIRENEFGISRWQNASIAVQSSNVPKSY
jgi:hypothetical protein